MKQYVLVVDDEKGFTFFLKKNLEAAGDYDVTICNEADKALERARQLRPNVILLDLMMPEISGEQIATALQEYPETKNIPVIFLTALVKSEETSEAAHMIGGHRFAAKPVKIDELVALLKQVTGSR
jgi:CheY-like chemotaxis protein